MKKNLFYLSFILTISCTKTNPPAPTPTENIKENCNTIHVRKDNSNTFYEPNPTYDNIPSNAMNSWKTSSFKEANIDSILFLAGKNKLEQHPTLFSFLMIRNDKIIFEKYFHGSEKDHSNNIHSASKCVLSALTGIAIHKAFLSLDQKAVDFFPNYSIDNTSKKKISIRHLLNMTSGLDWQEDETEYVIEDKTNWTEAILNLPLAHAPGSTFNYSTGNTHLLSAILTEATQVSNCDFAYENLFSNLGITVEHWGKDRQGYFSGGYNFYITPRELARFGLLYLNEGRYQSQQIIPQDWVNVSLSKQEYVDDDYDYSYGWWITNILGHDVFKAWGYGGQYICLIPDFDLMIVSTANTNSTYDEFDMDQFMEQYVIPAVE